MDELVSISPSTYQELGRVPVTPIDRIKIIVEEAHAAQPRWGYKTPRERVEILRPVFEYLFNQKAKLAVLQAQEMGMPLSLAMDDVEDSVHYTLWYLNNAEEYLNPETTFEDDTSKHTVYHEPLGVGAVILPWNFPLGNFVWGVVQSLIAGNAVILKQSEEIPLFSQFLFETLQDAGMPEHIFSIVVGDGTQGQQLLDQDIDYVGFTGSTKVGRLIYEQASKKFIKAILEMGGSAPGIIFDDATLNESVTDICDQRLFNGGQVCDGLKRLIVHESIAHTVVEQAKNIFEQKIVGIATDEATEIGPLVSKRQLEALKEQVKDAVDKGAQVVIGGIDVVDDFEGAFYRPTILTNVTADMRVWKEEVFGPVLPIVTFSTEEEAIQLANDTDYGLGSYVYSNNAARIERVAQQLKTGMVSVNGVSYVQPSSPFGGYKFSGLGREHGRFGFEELTQAKVVARGK